MSAGSRDRAVAVQSDEALDPGSTVVGRIAALHAALLRDDSATAALERWCRAHGVPATHAQVVAQLVVRRSDGAPAAHQRARLGVGPAEPVRYRRVRLCCDGRVLCEASNWFVPGRLTPAMNRQLEYTDLPFGRVIRALCFRRRLLDVERPRDAPAQGRGAPATDSAGAPPSYVLRHRALVVGADGVPLAEVEESYTRQALFLPEPQP